MSHLLFVDDDEDVRLLVRKIMEGAGHQVELVPDGYAALKAVEHSQPDLLILDLEMPGLSGLQVCQRLRQNPRTAHIPLLMLTAQGEIENRLSGFDAGADDYLVKPFDPRELRARVAALLRVVERESDRNPSSGLPGGQAVHRYIERRAARGAFGICYLDLDHFKPFADHFGFAVADEVIRRTGRYLQQLGNQVEDCCVGHIGGDDFIIVCSETDAPLLAQQAIDQFDEVLGPVVQPEALQAGCYRGVDRDGAQRDFAMTRLTAAALIVQPSGWVSVSHLGEFAAGLKRRAKQGGASSVVQILS